MLAVHTTVDVLLYLRDEPLVNLNILVEKETKDYLLNLIVFVKLLQVLTHSRQSNMGSILIWVAVDTRADTAERNALALVLFGPLKALVIAANKLRTVADFLILGRKIDRANSMNYMLASQPSIRLRDLCLASLSTIQLFALCFQLRTGRFVNRSIDTTASQETLVGCVDDGVHWKLADVALVDADLVVEFDVLWEASFEVFWDWDSAVVVEGGER